MKEKSVYSNMLRDLRGVRMSEHVRVRAENGVRLSAAIVEAVLGMASYVGLGAKRS
jgi:hypothetical protein